MCFSLPIHDVIYAFKRGVDAQLISQPYRAPVDLLPHPNLRGLWSRSLAIHRWHLLDTCRHALCDSHNVKKASIQRRGNVRH